MRFVLVAALGGLVLAGLAFAAPAPRTLRTSTPVTGLAMDGTTVAVATAWARGHCERVVAWSPLSPSLKALGRTTSCDETSTGRGILDQAVSGKRVAWIWDGGGNSHDSVLWAASLDTPQTAHRLQMATRSIDSGAGTYIGDLHASGSLLVYATWSVCDEGEPASRPCPLGVAPGTIYGSKLWRIDGTAGKKLIAAAPDELAPVAVSGGRILVVRGDGSFEVRGADGRIVTTLALDQPVLQATLGPKNVILAARMLATHPPQKTMLEFQVYDLQGGLVRTLPAPAAAQSLTAPRCQFPMGSSAAACLSPAAWLRFQDADATRLAYVLGTTVHLMRLATGKETTYAGTARTPVLAQLEAAGLVYSYGTAGRTQGRVQFVPAARLG
jgi:hypothetical protein